MKTKTSTDVIVIAKGNPESAGVTDDSIDASMSESFHMAANTNKQLSVTNMLSGDMIRLLVSNTHLSETISVTFTNQFLFDESENGDVESGKKKMFTLTKVGSLIVVTGDQFDS
jgi:hypothetical protein